MTQDVRTRWKHAARRHLLDALDQRGLARGLRVEFPRPGACVLAPFEEAQPGPGELLVESLATAVSTGTERAEYLRLPNVVVEYPHVPGYAQAGRVVAHGEGAAFVVGELVTTAGPHASLHLCPASAAIRVPPSVAPEHAALARIAMVAMAGVRRAAVQRGERVLVLGAGLVGHLAAQALRASGADVVIAATSPGRLEIARRAGLAPLALPDDDALERLAASVVIDATGNPAALSAALRAAARGGRIVLVGSPRGETSLDVAALTRKQVTLVGAHVGNLPKADEVPGAWTWQHECEAFLALVAAGRFDLGPVITRRAAPDEAPAVYAELAKPGDASLAVVFDWTRPGPWTPQLERASPLRFLGAGLRRAAGRGAAASPVATVTGSDGPKLRIGLIGCGEIAAASSDALRGASGLTVTWAADPRAELAQRLAGVWNAHSTRDEAELLAAADVDAVLISTPHDLHAPLAIRAAQAGKHVMVEKPMATRVADCDAMIAAASAKAVSLSVCYCLRFDPRLQRAQELIAAGALGRLLGTRISFAQERDAAYWSGGLSGSGSGDWRSKRASAGGGVLMMNACHLLDAVFWLAGRPIVEVSARAATLRHPVEVEDTICLSYRYEDGALGTLDATTALTGPWLFELQLWGTEGRLAITSELRFWSSRTVLGHDPRRWHVVRGGARPEERRRFFEAFARSIRSGTPLPVTAAEARHVQAVMAAAYASAASDRVAAVEP